MHGANDDASGTTAVLELELELELALAHAHALAAGAQPKRSILFVCYGAEEVGEIGSLYFAQHSLVPLAKIVTTSRATIWPVWPIWTCPSWPP